MADFTDLAWVEKVTKLSPANFNRMEAGIKDAAQNSKQRGLLSARPAASAATKNWLWTDSTTGVLSYCDGVAWYDIGGQTNASKAISCRCYHNATQSVAYGGVVLFNTARWANPAGMRNASFTSRIYATEDGLYDMGAYLFVSPLAVSGNWFQSVIRVTPANAGATYLVGDFYDNAVTTSIQATPTAQGVNLKAGDYIEVVVYQQGSVASALSAGGSADQRLCEFWLHKRGPAPV